LAQQTQLDKLLSRKKIDYAVDYVDSLLVQLRSRRVKVPRRDDSDAKGRLAWILDSPKKNEAELWDPKR